MKSTFGLNSFAITAGIRPKWQLLFFSLSSELSFRFSRTKTTRRSWVILPPDEMPVGADGGPTRASDPSDRQVRELRYTGVIQPCIHPAEQTLSGGISWKKTRDI